MTKTQYLPAEWLDEIVPDPCDSPDDFIHHHEGKWFLWPNDEDQEERETWSMTIATGETVSFCEFRDHGHWAITITGERDPEGRAVWHGGETINAEANCFHFDDGYCEAFGGTLDEMVAAMVEDNPKVDGTFSVHAYHWSDGANWIFTVRDGQGRLTKAEAVH